MKWTLVVAVCMALVAVQAVSVQNDLNLGTSLLPIQKFILGILRHVTGPLLCEEGIKLAGQMITEKIITDKTYFTVYDNDMQIFAGLYIAQNLQPKNVFFTPMQHNSAQQMRGFYKLLYYAKDTATMMKIAAWGRMNVNPAVLVHSIYMAVGNRQDMQNIVLPPIYEVLPQMFLSSKYILPAERFDWPTFNRKIMLEKELQGVYAKQYPVHLYGKQFHQMDFKAWQWWKLMGLDDGWHLEGKSMLRENYEVLRKDPIWMSIYSQLQMIWMPIDYSRDVGILNEEAKVAYLTEDLGWNAYWYNFNMGYLALLDDSESQGAYWLNTMKQMFARYSMERFSQGLNKVEPISWYGIIQAGFNPQLITTNGNGFSMRQNNQHVQSLFNPSNFNQLLGVYAQIQDISTGQYSLKNGTLLKLSLPETIELIGDLLQGNQNIVGTYPWLPMVAALLGGADFHGYSALPNVILNYEHMLCDPVAYQVLKTMINMVNLLCTHQLVPYTQKELILPGVKILNVDVSQMKTYYDLVDVDMSTLLNDKMVYHDGQLVWDKVLLGRQMRLNHEPFKFQIQVAAEVAQPVVVRIFLGPEFDQYGQKMDMHQNLEYYMQLDEFLYDLVVGENMIARSSEDFAWTSSDPYTYSELYNYVIMAIEGKYQFNPQLFESHLLFPDRLILPQGWVEGMPMGLFISVSPYHPPEIDSPIGTGIRSGFGIGMGNIDNMPFSYPLDRPIVNLNEFIVPNMYYKTVMIYHQEKFGNYYPLMYEHFGVFDESF